ncbi:MAG: phosphoribosyltransferase family protein [Holophagae bacterium]|jgi:hypoxanthine phosphoribosyltransferase
MSTLRVVYTADQIRQRLGELVAEISADYEGKALTLVGILKGSAFFLTDIARMFEPTVSLDFEFVDVTTAAGERGEVVSLTFATRINVTGRHVLILKDVFHSGITENYLITHLSQQKPASIEVVALVDRPQLRSVNLTARYAAFDDLPDGYLIGYGLGPSRSEHTNLPDLCVLTGGEQPTSA